jgi:hypothetical protein
MDHNAAMLGFGSIMKKAFAPSIQINRPKPKRTNFMAPALGLGGMAAGGLLLHRMMKGNPAQSPLQFKSNWSPTHSSVAQKMNAGMEGAMDSVLPKNLQTPDMISRYGGVPAAATGIGAGLSALTSPIKSIQKVPVLGKLLGGLRSSPVGRGLNTFFNFQAGTHPLIAEGFSDNLQRAGINMSPDKSRYLSGGLMAAATKNPWVGIPNSILTPIVLDRKLQNLAGSAAKGQMHGNSGELFLDAIRKMKNNSPDSLDAAKEVMAWRQMFADKVPGLAEDSPVVANLLNRATQAAQGVRPQ